LRTEEGSSKAQEGYLIAKTLRSFEMIGEMWRGIGTTGCTEADAPCRGHRARPLAVSSSARCSNQADFRLYAGLAQPPRISPRTISIRL
jgi:hypothetical protein